MVESGRFDQSNAIQIVFVRCEERQVSRVVAAGKEYVFALIIIDEETERFCALLRHILD
jgi:hypothetical protein